MITPKEYSLLNAIVHHEYTTCNGATPTTHEDAHTFLWVDDFAKTLRDSTESIRGVLGSLVKKEMIFTDEPDRYDPDGTVGLTEKGFKVFLEHQAKT